MRPYWNDRGRTILSLLVALALLVAILPLPAAVAAPAAPGPLAGEEVRGTLDNWQNPPAWAMSGSLGGTFIYNSAQIASCGAEQFKFYNNTGWYGNGATVSFASILTGLNTGGGDINYTCTGGKYYTWKWDAGARGVLFQLSAAPVNISAVSRLPVAPTSSDPVVVTATTDATPPAEQALWLRYAINNAWGSSTVLKMTGSGTSYSATIPAQANGAQVSYYVFSSGDVASIAGGDADLMAITSNTNSGSNYSYTVASAPGVIAPTQARAMWLDTNTMAWNAAAAASYRLLYDPDGGLTTAAEATACTFPSPAAPCYVTLTASGTVSGFPKNPNATGKIRLLTGLSADDAKHLLKGQVVVASYDGGGARVDATRVQIQSVLDALYAASAKTQTLGVTYSGGAPSVKVWAPTAKSVTLKRYATSAGAEVGSHPMTLDAASGVWSVTGAAGWDRQFYLFDVQVYVPSTDAVENNLVSDPYAVSLSQDGAATFDVRSQFVNLADADLKPTGWDSLSKPALAAFEDSVIYEAHVRDFSANDATVAAGDRGTYKAFTYDGAGPHPNATLSDGMSHLKQLQQAGLTHIHLLPAFDIASVIEPAAQRTEPTVPAAPRDSSNQQAAVGAARTTDSFNWGYDPFHYGLPEGSYSTNPDGVQRILEFRDMVSALNQNGLRVVMDVVYNHTAASGQGDKSVLDRVVPGYYYRYDAVGVLYTTSCCDDTATEYEMMEKLMIDTVVRFAADYKVDGFRFDLMNFHTRQNMLNVKSAIQALTPGSHGVEGDEIYLYGEGWTFGSAQSKGFTTCPNCFADKYNMTGAGIGLFNDIIRDAAHGGYSEDSLQIRKQGFINGLSYDWNGYEYNNRWQSDLHAATDRLRSALRGSGADWNGQGNPFTDDPQEAVNYVEKHDNETLFDQNVFKLPNGSGSGNPGWIGSGIPTTSMAERVRSQNMGVSIVGLAQGIPFIQMGQDILRSKSLDRNSYDSGDWFNRVYWNRSSNNFGVGLPPSWDNSTRWPIMGPLLANTALDPALADMNFAAAHLRETLRIRKSSPLFRLHTEADINARVSHYNNGNTEDALIVMRLSDEPAPDLDSNWENILVFFNAHKIAQTFTIAGANGFTLHPLHTNGVDDDAVITGGASFNDGADTFTIPARSTVVFVSTQTLVAPLAPSSIDWVGKMWPRGGVANAINQGAFAPTGFDIFVRVYDFGVTPNPGAPAGISCYAHWGKYGVPFSDLAMSWNTQIGNDDEFKATISQATLNALGPGTYGFTAYCLRAGEEKKWKVDEYNISAANDDDQGDGLITVIPTADSSVEPPAGVFVHLFEWRWADIEKECTFLAAKGFTGVQVSPPNEHLVPTANQGGQPAAQFPWWARYQPVTHLVGPSTFTSRSGTWAEFTSMINACNALGVGIYVDAVINHMADIEVGSPPTGTAGTQYDNGVPNPATRFYGTQYQADDFHSPECTISNYKDRNQVQRCKLSGLPDLHTGKSDVQTEIRNYLQALLNAGVKGFRIDGAKHMAAHDIAAILNGLTGSFYLFQEAIDIDPSERVRDWEYTPSGDVTEFEYSVNAMGNKFNNCSGVISDLQTFTTWSGMMPTRFAQVFVDNHDNQRGHGPGGTCIVDHRDGAVHRLANIFTLAYPYGHPSVMSSYYWSTNPASQAGDSLGPPTVNGGPGTSGATLPVYGAGQAAGDYPANCSGMYPAEPTNDDLGKWVCEHRNTAIANMVKFRLVTNGQPVTNWQTIGGASSNHIAFGRGDKGFVAINRTGSEATTTYQTGMAAGAYCDITKYDYIPATGQCIDPVTTVRAPDDAWIVVNSSGQIVNQTLDAMDAFAIYAGGSPLAVTLASFDAQAQAGHVLVSWETASELDNAGFNLYRTGTAAAQPGPADLLTFVPSQAPGASQGAAYSFADSSVVAGQTYWYWLEDVDVNGTTALHGPVSVVYQAPTAVTLTAVRADSAPRPALLAWLALLAFIAAGALAVIHTLRRARAG